MRLERGRKDKQMNVRSSIVDRYAFREDLKGGLNSSQNWLTERGKDSGGTISLKSEAISSVKLVRSCIG